MAKHISLIVAADEPALFYSSVEAAEQDLEAIDVEDGIYSAAYGPDGALYQIEVKNDRVVIRLDNSEAPRPEALKTLLLSFLSAIGTPARQDDSLSALLDRCTPHLDS
jgi:hypothetical protein